ncbi:cysteine synthase [Nocardioides gansuensis]|uniref:L-cysteine desulfhydrase Cds1 n=1 Tax=Nocardioides gansuensis TaxID=2138300 RepID=A0A2T8FF55_9ACTN|nr:PLP-dependent cysteine synthase family protein [Nocardioides gansuensis]PVG84343.1 cysteine synthase [Nocardioides gansuensis]
MTGTTPRPLVEHEAVRRGERAWVADAIHRLKSDMNRSADTHLVGVPIPALPGVDLYLKDESTHPTGSLKHRLARSLFLYGLCSGLIHEGTPVVEASSGSTAVSEAFFARMLGLPFTAVMARSTSPSKVELIGFYGGSCHFVDEPSQVYEEARRLASETGGHYMDQFTYAERATDWRGNNNIAESIFEQMALERHPIPAWILVGAGTGGTSATLGRYVRYQCHDTKVAVVDPENSVFFPSYRDGCLDEWSGQPSRIEGIGRPRCEPSFLPDIVDRMVSVPDAASVAASHFLRARTGQLAGPSTGTALYAATKLACEMGAAGTEGSIVTLMCDTGVRYLHTYFDRDWVADQGWDLAPYLAVLDRAWDHGEWTG